MGRGYRCTGCGGTFCADNGVIVHDSHGFNDGFFETIMTCPDCGCDSLETMVVCSLCGEMVYPDDTYCGICSDCLRRECTWERAIAYLKNKGLCGEFFCYWLCDCENNHVKHSIDFDDVALWCIEQNKCESLLNNLRDYILEDESDFADWLVQKTKMEKMEGEQ